jgi:hypothetical protein
MTEAGLLGAYIPEFGDIVARTQFNMYHRFTVDEHTLNALGLLREIEQGKHANEHPLVTSFAGELNHRRALHLAVLLHDTGKGKGDQCVEGAQNARIACPRLGLDEAETELVAWLIEHHLDMSDTAQRRDISDPRTVLDFAEIVGSLERLRLSVLPDRGGHSRGGARCMEWLESPASARSLHRHGLRAGRDGSKRRGRRPRAACRAGRGGQGALSSSCGPSGLRTRGSLGRQPGRHLLAGV